MLSHTSNDKSLFINIICSVPVPSVKEAQAEVQFTEELTNHYVSVPSFKHQGTQTEISETPIDQKSIPSEFELGCSHDVLDIYEDMHHIFNDPEDTECVSPSQSNTSIRSFIKRMKKSTSARLAHKAQKIVHRVARSILTSPLLKV